MILFIAAAVLKQWKMYEARMLCCLLSGEQNANLWHVFQTGVIYISNITLANPD